MALTDTESISALPRSSGWAPWRSWSSASSFRSSGSSDDSAGWDQPGDPARKTEVSAGDGKAPGTAPAPVRRELPPPSPRAAYPAASGDRWRARGRPTMILNPRRAAEPAAHRLRIDAAVQHRRDQETGGRPAATVLSRPEQRHLRSRTVRHAGEGVAGRLAACSACAPIVDA